jgi:DNA-binding transcriptional ArsR family regulator
MQDGPHIARVAALVGDTARAEMLTALMSDRALTATELAAIAGVTKQTASAHLAKLTAAGLVAVASQGRHRYFRLADRDVAQLLEQLMGVAFRSGAVRLRSSPREPALRHARICYDHLAGELGVQLFEALERQRWLSRKRRAAPSFLDPRGGRAGRSPALGALGKRGGALELTPAGERLCGEFGIDVAALAEQRRPLVRPCLDWSARRHHLAGALGAALLDRCTQLGWLRRQKDSRVLVFSAAGERAFRERFGIAV